MITISEQARAIVALDNELQLLDSGINELQAKLIVAQQKRSALIAAISELHKQRVVAYD